MSKKYIAVLCVFFVVINLFFDGITLIQASETDLEYIAPQNPEFTQYLSQENVKLESVDDYMITGYIPSPVELPNYKQPNSRHQFDILASNPLPSKYDLRDYGYITSVKDQKISGPCWAFAATGALESSLIKTGELSADLSENHMMYSTSTYGGNTEGFDGPPHSRGGNYSMSTAYYMRWGGPVLESSDPFPLQGPYDTVRSAMITNTYEPIKHVDSIINLPNLSSTATEAEKISHRNKVKELIVAYGAVAQSTYYDNGYQNPTGTAYYYNGTTTVNHGVEIIGWDDNYSKDNFNPSLKPPGDGAWIIKNSWGSYNSLGGYYYLSYYDSFAEHDVMAIKSVSETDNYDNIYQYDPLGMSAYTSIGSSCEFANVFNKGYSGEILKGVSFYNISQNTDYQVYINTNLTTSPDTKLNDVDMTLVAQGNLADAGYFTIPITPTEIKGSKFVVTVRITTTDGKNANIPLEYYVPGYSTNVSASPNQSFVRGSTTSGWADLTTLDDSLQTANVCIKAYTSDIPLNTPPNVLNSNPLDNATNVAVDITPSITFDQKVLAGTSYLSITFKANNQDVPFTPSLNKGKLTLIPSTTLMPSTTYTITLPMDSVQNSNGLIMTSNYELSFTTEDRRPLNVLSSNPEINATNVVTTISPSITFDQKILQGSGFNNITMKAGNADVLFNVIFSGSTLSFIPITPLTPSVTYTIIIPVDGIKSLSGGTLATNYVLSFQTTSVSFEKFLPNTTQQYIKYPTCIAVDRNGNFYVGNDESCCVQKYDSSGNLIVRWGSVGIGNGQFQNISGITVDANDNVYVVEGNRVQKFNSAGKYLSQFGSFGTGNGQFSGSGGIAVDSSGNIYVVDFGNKRIQKFNSLGVYLLQWGSEGSGNSQFLYPNGIAVDHDDNIYVSDYGNDRIQKFDSSGEYLLQWGSFGFGDGQFNNAYGIAVDSSNNIYVSDGGKVHKFSSSGAFLGKWGSLGDDDNQFINAYGIAYYNGYVYITDFDNNKVLKFTDSGTFIYKLSSYGDGIGEFHTPMDIAKDSNNNLYVLDQENNRIQKFNSLGEFVTQWGGYGSINGKFRGPTSIAIDSNDNIYVADKQNNRIQKFNSSGTYLGKWGSRGTGDGQFTDLYGIAIDSNDNVYVTDHMNHCIQKFNSSGAYIIKWGSMGSGNGQFKFPRGLTIDSNNDIYVLDTANNRVQKFSSSGAYLSQWASDDDYSLFADIAIDNRGYVYITDDRLMKLKKYDMSGELISQFGFGSDSVPFSFPSGIIADSTNKIYVADSGNNRILLMDVNKNPTSLDVSSSNPTNNATNVSVNIHPKFTFSQEVSAGTDFSKITFIAGNEVVLFTSTISENTLTLIPSTKLLPKTTYTIVIPINGVKGPTGLTLSNDYTLNYTTAEASLVSIIDSIPQNNATNVEMNIAPVIDFNQTISPGSAYNNITFKKGNENVSFAAIISGNTLTIKPSAPLSQGAAYTITVPVNSVISSGGGTLLTNYTLSFTTTPIAFVKYLPNASGSNISFYYPRDTAIDSQNNIYVLDTNNCCIKKFDSGGTYMTQWGNYGYGNGQLNIPQGMAVDNNDNIYVADSFSNRIQKFSSSGIYLSTIGGAGTGNGQFNFPIGIAIDSCSNIYVVDCNNNRIQKFDSSGTYITQWGSKGTGNGQFNQPYGIALDSNGDVYVADSLNHRIQKFDSNGNYMMQWKTDNAINARPVDITIGKKGNVYVTDQTLCDVKQFDLNGNFMNRWIGGNDGSPFNSPRGVKVDSKDNVYVADSNNNRIMFMNINPLPLYILSSDPANGATNVAPSVVPTITFDQSILSGTAYNNITFKKGNENISFVPSISGSSLTLTPSTALEVGMTYTITIPENSIQNSSGYTVNNSFILNFTTGDVKYGDINGDGLINISDVIMAAEIAVGYTNLTQVQINRANVSSKSDPTVDIADVVLIIERVVGGTAPFPVELQ